MNALDQFRTMIEEHWPHSNPQWRENGVGFALEIDAIADHIEEEYRILQAERDTAVQTATDQAGARRKLQDRIEAEMMSLPRDKNGEIIHIGDRVELRYGSGETVEVYGVNDHAVYTQIGCHGADLVKLSKHETIDDVRNEITKDWDYAHDLIERAYECGKRDAE